VIHDPGKTADEILKAADAEIAALQEKPLEQKVLDRALVKLRSALYGEMEQFVGFGKVDLLASFALFDDDPGRINRLEDEFKAVTPELVQKTAREYLRPTNRTVLVLEPKATPAPSAAQKK
jgi:predicted Zn-dependent peptidase